MNYKCQICDKTETCKKNKNSSTTNCRLFVPNEEKELEYLKQKAEREKRLKEIHKKIWNNYGRHFAKVSDEVGEMLVND